MEQYSDRNVLINGFYNNFIAQVGGIEEENPNKYAWLCGWSDKHNQYKRFEVLTQIGLKNKDTVLDIGCGGGEFVQYDINPFYLRIAQARFPKSTFLTSNGWDLTSNDYDWAIASGVFTVEASVTYILWYVGYVMERLVKKGFAFNLLNDKAPDSLERYQPAEILQTLQERFPEYKVQIVEGYLADDFTVYVKK
jgi:SAM-dependent methyltransferase